MPLYKIYLYLQEGQNTWNNFCGIGYWWVGDKCWVCE